MIPPSAQHHAPPSITLSSFELLPTETLANILHVTADACGLTALLALASTSYRLHQVYLVHRSALNTSALDTTYGRIDDIIQLATHNASQEPHIRRNVPPSAALERDIIHFGKTASRWENIYPFKKWPGKHSINRRLLTDHERRRLRRAIYRIWLYDMAYHNPHFSRYTRRMLQVQTKRQQLLQGWSTSELTEVVDVQRIFRRVLAVNVCPSNGRVEKKVQARYGQEYALNLFFSSEGASRLQPTQIAYLGGHTHYQHQPQTRNSRYLSNAQHDPGEEGFGDDVRYAQPQRTCQTKYSYSHSHYYKIADMLKLDPAQILHLYTSTFTKAEVEAYVYTSTSTCNNGIYINPDWFYDNGETFGESVYQCLGSRHVSIQDFELDLGEGRTGIATNPEC